MASLADLRAKVAANTTVVASAITLIQGIKQKLDAAIAQNDPVALQALSDELDNSDQTLAAAILANTPTSTAPASAPATPADPAVPTAPAEPTAP